MTPFGGSPLQLVKHLVDFDKTEGVETHQLFEVPSKTAQGHNRAFQPVSEFVVLWGARAVFLHLAVAGLISAERPSDDILHQ